MRPVCYALFVLFFCLFYRISAQRREDERPEKALKLNIVSARETVP